MGLKDIKIGEEFELKSGIKVSISDIKVEHSELSSKFNTLLLLESVKENISEWTDLRDFLKYIPGEY